MCVHNIFVHIYIYTCIHDFELPFSACTAALKCLAAATYSYIRIHIRTYMYIYIYILTNSLLVRGQKPSNIEQQSRIRIYRHIFVHIPICVYVHIYKLPSISRTAALKRFVQLHIRIHSYIFVHIHIYIHIYLYICIYELPSSARTAALKRLAAATYSCSCALSSLGFSQARRKDLTNKCISLDSFERSMGNGGPFLSWRRIDSYVSHCVLEIW